MGGFASPGQSIVWHGGRRIVVGTPAAGAPVADILLDFVNSIYRVDGVTYATAALAGFPGTGTFNASGYTATGTQSISGAVNLAGDFIVYIEYVFPAAGAKVAWSHNSAVLPLIQYTSGNINSNPALISSPTATKVAFGLSGGVRKGSADNAATQTGAAFAAPGSAALFIGNLNDGSLPWGSAIRKFAVYKQILSDAQIQALN